MKCENPDCNNEHDGSYGSGRFCSEHCRRSFCGKKKLHHKCNFNVRRKHKDWICTICGEVFQTRDEMKIHRKNVHHWKKGMAWNKGLTDKSDDRVRKQHENLKKSYSSNRISPWNKGKNTSDEVRLKISKSRKRYLISHPDKVPYVLNHSSNESFPEKFFRTAFENEKFPQFIQDKYVQGYFLDFAFPEKHLYVEVDGEQHYLDKRIVEHDKVRTQVLNTTEWRCVCRIRWSKFQKLSDEYKHRFILGLKNKLTI